MPPATTTRSTREHRKVLGYDGCGYHFVIGNGTGSADGQIEVAQRWVNQKHGVHCRNAKNAEVDEYGIGICFVGDLDKEPPTPRQVAAAKALIAYLSSRYTIARSRVETHAHLAATPTVCPGRHFPAAAILAAKPRARNDEATARRPVPTSWRMARRARARGLLNRPLDQLREPPAEPSPTRTEAGFTSHHSSPSLSSLAAAAPPRASRAITVMESVISPRRSIAQASSQSIAST